MHRFSARLARAISRRSRIRVFANTVSRMIRRPGAIQVRNAYCSLLQVEAEFSELAVELPRVRLAKQRPVRRQEVDVERCCRELLGRQSLQPVPDLRFQLHATPIHSVDAMEVH